MPDQLEGRESIGSSSEMPRLRGLWDHLPRGFRRGVIRLLSNDRIRLPLLSLFHIRSQQGFAPLSRGLGAIDFGLQKIHEQETPGDYYEFGLFRGYSFWYAQHSAERIGLDDMRFFGFDSFQGLPDIEGADKDRGVFFSGDYVCTKENVEAMISSHGFDWSKAHLVEGFYDESLTPTLAQELDMGKAALVLVDCDLYQSTVPVLRFVEPLLQDGTIMLFDDWHCFGGGNDSGEPKAFHEFLTSHPEWTAEHLLDFPVYGRAFRMRLNGGAGS